MIKGNSKINLDGTIVSLDVRGYLAWSVKSERPITEGSRYDEANEILGGLEGARALPVNRISQFSVCLNRPGYLIGINYCGECDVSSRSDTILRQAVAFLRVIDPAFPWWYDQARWSLWWYDKFCAW